MVSCGPSRNHLVARGKFNPPRRGSLRLLLIIMINPFPRYQKKDAETYLHTLFDLSRLY